MNFHRRNRLWIGFFLIFAVILVTGCQKQHEHVVEKATCIKPEYCKICGEVQDNAALGHTFGEWKVINSETEQRMCMECGKEETRNRTIENEKADVQNEKEVAEKIKQCMQSPDLYADAIGTGELSGEEGAWYYLTGFVGDVIDETEDEIHVSLHTYHCITPDDEYFDMPIDLAIKKDQPMPEAESVVRVYGEYIGSRVHQTTHRDYESYPCMNVIYVENGNIEDMITQR